MANLDEALKIAIKAARKAGEIAKKDFLKPQVAKIKDHHEFVTKTDLKCERAIIKIIKSKFPKHSIWSEERAEENNKSKYEWVIDPLDGTHNFMKNNAVFGHSIALTKNKKTLLGVIYFPIMNHMYCGIRGRGVRLNKKIVRVSKTKSFVMLGVNYFQSMNEKQLKILMKIIKRGADIRIMGSACYNFCLVANGGYACYFEKELKPGDFAAGAFLVEEAGGRVTRDDGKAWDLETKNFIASNSIMHNKLLKILKPFKGIA